MSTPSINCKLKKSFKSIIHSLTSIGGLVKTGGSLYLIFLSRCTIGTRADEDIIVLPLVLEGARPLRSIGYLPLREGWLYEVASLFKA